MSCLMDYESQAVGYVTLKITHYKPAVACRTSGHPELQHDGEDAELDFEVVGVADGTCDPQEVHQAMEEEFQDILGCVERGEGLRV